MKRFEHQIPVSILCVGAIVLTAIALSWALIDGTGIVEGNDTRFSYHAAFGFTQSLQEGVLYPRWLDNSNGGLGAPIFIYYPPLAYYFHAFCFFLVGDLIDAFRVEIVCLYILVGLSFFFSARRLFSKTWAFSGAILYLCAPYFALNLYYRFALAEFSAAIFLPPVAVFFLELHNRSSASAWLGFTLSFIGLVLTHTVSAFLTAILLAGLFAYQGDYRHWRQIGLTALVVLLICAPYLLGIFQHYNDTNLDHLTTTYVGNWRRNLAFIDEVAQGFQRANIKHWIHNILFLQLVIWFLSAVTILSIGTKLNKHYLVAAAFALALQTPLSWPVWTYLPLLETVQFPWRFNSLATLFLVLTIIHMGQFSSGTKSAFVPVVLAIVGFSLISGNIISHSRIGFDGKSGNQHRARYFGVGEYKPKSRKRESLPVKKPIKTSRSKIVLTRGKVEIDRWDNHYRRLTISTAAGSELRILNFMFPRWEYSLDGGKIRPLVVQTSNLPLFAIPAGEHVFEMRFKEPITPWIMTFAGFVVLGGGFVFWRRRESVLRC